MKTKTCKYCGNVVNIKAEICPKCGCRIKSNVFKISIICILTICALFGLYLLYINIYDSMHKTENNSVISKYSSSYELVEGDIKNITQITDSIEKINSIIIIDKYNTKVVNNIDNLAQNHYYIVSNDNEEFLYCGIHMLASYTDNHTDLDLQVCFKLDGDYLTQITCPESSNKPHFKTDNVNLKYKKNNTSIN